MNKKTVIIASVLGAAAITGTVIFLKKRKRNGNSIDRGPSSESSSTRPPSSNDKAASPPSIASSAKVAPKGLLAKIKAKPKRSGGIVSRVKSKVSARRDARRKRKSGIDGELF